MPAASTLASLLDPESPATSPTQPPPIPGVLSSCAPCPALAPAGGAVLTPGQVGYVCDASGFLHAVRAAPEGGGAGGVTLHVYAPPITRCRLFEPAEDRVTLRAPGFFSANGARLPVHGASFGAHVGAGDEAGPSRAPPAWGPER